MVVLNLTLVFSLAALTNFNIVITMSCIGKYIKFNHSKSFITNCNCAILPMLSCTCNVHGCVRKLDVKIVPTDLEGTLYCSYRNCSYNPDWISQKACCGRFSTSLVRLAYNSKSCGRQMSTVYSIEFSPANIEYY